jgi:hypothetical protein
MRQLRQRRARAGISGFSILDKAGALKMSHKEIAEYLYDKRGVPGWWCQMVAVTYEQERGIREKHERPDGYSVSASRTFEVSINTLYKHWNNGKLRSGWLRDKIVVRRATANKSMRITWGDNTHVDVYFYKKGATKSQVSVQHSKLDDLTQVERTRSRWKTALKRLSGML